MARADQDSKIKQISLCETAKNSYVTTIGTRSFETQKKELDIYQNAVLDLNKVQDFPLKLRERFCSDPLLAPESHVEGLKKIHDALHKALVDIVDRWWTDEAAAFPKRMALEDHEEELLKWIAHGATSPLLPYAETHAGFYRPDYLIQEVQESTGETEERIVICEINARFPFNGFSMSSHIHHGYGKLAPDAMKLLRPGCEFYAVMPKAIKRFSDQHPLHIIMSEKWPGVDIHVVGEYFAETTGQKVVYVKASQLRIELDEKSSTGFSLFYEVDEDPKRFENQVKNSAVTPIDLRSRVKHSADDESQGQEPNLPRSTRPLERIHQASVELEQHELKAIPMDVLKQLATCCVNDFRNALLLHDKRMLGILLEELDNLVQRQKLSLEERNLLEQSIAPTYSPGSAAMMKILEECKTNPSLKDELMLKSIRAGAAQGHTFGSDIDNDQWVAELERLQRLSMKPSDNPLSLQRLGKQAWYDIVRIDEKFQGKPEQFHIVATSLAVNGRFVGQGPIRIARQLHLPPREKEGGILLGWVIPR